MKIASEVKDIDGRLAIQVPVLMAHPHLGEAQAFKRNGKETGEKKFGATFVLEPDSPALKAVKDKAIALAKAAWPGRSLKDIQFPISSGTAAADARAAACAEKGKAPDGEYQRGKALLKARGKYQPKLGVIRGGKVVDIDPARTSASEINNAFFFGEMVLVEVNLAPYEGGTGPDGITAYLNTVVATGKGTRIAGGGKSASETFSGYVGTVSDESVAPATEDEWNIAA